MEKSDEYDGDHTGGPLTVDEREVLGAALEAGYFDVPRTATITDVTGRVDRPMTDVSQHLRAGIGKVLRGTNVLSMPGLTDDDPSGREGLDQLFDAFGHRYRRRVLLLVTQRSPHERVELSVDALVSDGRDPGRLRTELYHAHLPKLERAGYVDWDREGQTVRRGPNFDEATQFVELLYEHWDELPTG